MDNLAYLFAVAVHFTGLPAIAPQAQPAIVPVSEEQMRRLACGASEAQCNGLQALYDHHRNRILVREYGAQRGAEWESFVVHEYVHALQYAQ